MNRQQLRERIESRWREFWQSLEGLPERAMLEPGAIGEWSFKDVIGHLTTWEEETLKALPLILKGQRTQPYGGIDAFNAREAARKRGLSLAEVRSQAEATHRRLLVYLEGVPESAYATETRFRRRLRLDTYGHYREHTRAITAWRKARGL